MTNTSPLDIGADDFTAFYSKAADGANWQTRSPQGTVVARFDNLIDAVAEAVIRTRGISTVSYIDETGQRVRYDVDSL